MVASRATIRFASHRIASHSRGGGGQHHLDNWAMMPSDQNKACQICKYPNCDIRFLGCGCTFHAVSFKKLSFVHSLLLLHKTMHNKVLWIGGAFQFCPLSKWIRRVSRFNKSGVVSGSGHKNICLWDRQRSSLSHKKIFTFYLPSEMYSLIPCAGFQQPLSAGF